MSLARTTQQTDPTFVAHVITLVSWLPTPSQRFLHCGPLHCGLGKVAKPERCRRAVLAGFRRFLWLGPTTLASIQKQQTHREPVTHGAADAVRHAILKNPMRARHHASEPKRTDYTYVLVRVVERSPPPASFLGQVAPARERRRETFVPQTKDASEGECFRVPKTVRRRPLALPNTFWR